MTTTPAATALPFLHRAAYYRDGSDLVDVLVPLLRGAVERGEAVVVVLDGPTTDAVRDGLGPLAGSVEFTDPADVHGYSGQTTAARRANQLRELTAGGRRAVFVDQYGADVDGGSAAYRSEVDAAMNIALAGVPVTVVCPYPVRASRQLAAAARWNHHELLVDGALRPNPALRRPVDVLAAVPVASAPELGPPTEEQAFGGAVTRLRGIRADARRHAADAGLDDDQIGEFVLALSELVTNSIEHGAGHGTVRWWVYPGRVVAEVHDPGRLRDTLPGMRPPVVTGERGRGVWLARRFCRTVHLWAAADGTHARIESAA